MSSFNTHQNPDNAPQDSDKPQGQQTSEGEMTAGALIESVYKNKFHALTITLLNQLNNVIGEEGKSGETHVAQYRDGLTSLLVNRAPENAIVGPDEAETFWQQHDQIANNLLSSDSELTKQVLNLIQRAKEETAEISKKTKQQIEALGVPTAQPAQATPAQNTSEETAISISKRIEVEPIVPFSEEEKERVKNAAKSLEFRLRNNPSQKTKEQLINEHNLRLTQKLRIEFHNGEPKRELEEVKALVVHYLERIYKLRAEHPTSRTIKPKNKEIKNKVEFSEDELRYIRTSWNNFRQHNKRKKSKKLSKTKHVERMVKFLNANFHGGEPVRTTQQISGMLVKEEKTSKKREVAKVSSEIRFTNDELKYIRQARKNFLQNKRTHRTKTSWAGALEKMAVFINIKFHNGKEVRTAQEIDKFWAERKRQGRLKNYERAFPKKEKAMSGKPFTPEAIKYIIKSCENYRKRKRDGSKTSSMEHFATMAAYLNRNFHNGKPVYTAKSVKEWYEARKQSYSDRGQSLPKENSPKKPKAPEAAKKQEVVINQLWMKAVTEAHSDDKRLHFEKKFIFAAWQFYAPEKINKLSNIAVQSLTHILSILRRKAKHINSQNYKNCKVFVFQEVDSNTFRRMISKMLSCCLDLNVTVPKLSKKEVDQNRSWLKNVKERHPANQHQLVIDKKLIHALNTYYKKAKFDQLNTLQKWVLTRITSGLHENSKICRSSSSDDIRYSFSTLDINAIEKILTEIFEVIDANQPPASESTVSPQPKTLGVNQANSVNEPPHNPVINTINQALSEQEKVIAECVKELTALSSNEKVKETKTQLEKLQKKAPSTSDVKAFAQWVENLNLLVAELQVAESGAEFEAKPMSDKQLRAKTVKLLERKKAAQDLRQKITSTLNRLAKKVVN